MRLPCLWCSISLLTLAAPDLARAAAGDGPSLSLAGTVLTISSDAPSLVDSYAAADFASPPGRFLNPVLPPYPAPAVGGDTLLLAEAHLTWQLTPARLPGRVTVGTWSDPAFGGADDAASFPGGSRPAILTPYLVFDQTLWRASPADGSDVRGVGLFLIYDHVNADLFPTTEHFAAGMSVAGPFVGRPDDLLGIGLSYAHLTSDPAADFSKGSETAVEVFYRFRVTPHLAVRPEVRYVLDPATEDAAGAVVASVQLDFEY
jgi:carbohydrate-selective porin OprB